MRIVRFRDAQGTVSHGVIQGDQVIQIVGDLYDHWQAAGPATALAKVQLLAPIVPRNILCIGRNYLEHAQEGQAEMPTSPLLFIKATSALTDPGGTIRLPRVAPERVDFEAELAVVIGRAAKHVSPQDALSHVLGYTCANDVSARDVQKGEGQWARGKSFDTFAPLGPWIETELDPSRLAVVGRLNGQIMQQGNTADMAFDVRAIIANLSGAMTLLPGTVIFTGTPAGCGFARTPPVWLKPGDEYEVDIQGIGVLSNPVAAE